MLQSIYDLAGTRPQYTSSDKLLNLGKSRIKHMHYKTEQYTCNYLDRHGIIYKHGAQPKWLLGLHLDFYIHTRNKKRPNIAIEYDGPGHKYNIYGKHVLKKQIRNDAEKNTLCKKNNVKLIRINGVNYKTSQQYVKVINNTLNENLLPLLPKHFSKKLSRTQLYHQCKNAILSHTLCWTKNEVTDSETIWHMLDPYNYIHKWKYISFIQLLLKRYGLINPLFTHLLNKAAYIISDHYTYYFRSANHMYTIDSIHDIRINALLHALIAKYYLSPFKHINIPIVLKYPNPYYIYSSHTQYIALHLGNIMSNSNSITQHIVSALHAINLKAGNLESSYTICAGVEQSFKCLCAYFLAYPDLLKYNKKNHHLQLINKSKIKHVIRRICGCVFSHKNDKCTPLDQDDYIKNRKDFIAVTSVQNLAKWDA